MGLLNRSSAVRVVEYVLRATPQYHRGQGSGNRHGDDRLEPQSEQVRYVMLALRQWRMTQEAAIRFVLSHHSSSNRHLLCTYTTIAAATLITGRAVIGV